MPDERLHLAGEHVELVPLAPDHVDELVAAATIDRSSYGFTEVPGDAEHMAAYVANLLAKRRRRHRPAVRPAAAAATAGSSAARASWTCAAGAAAPSPTRSRSAARGSPPTSSARALNTEAKLLLLTHAFETWHVDRVAIATDARNERSRRAIERIGATFEGVLRHHRPSMAPGEAGRPRDTALFAITDDEWPGVRRDLEQPAWA